MLVSVLSFPFFSLMSELLRNPYLNRSAEIYVNRVQRPFKLLHGYINLHFMLFCSPPGLIRGTSHPVSYL